LSTARFKPPTSDTPLKRHLSSSKEGEEEKINLSSPMTETEKCAWLRYLCPDG